MSDDFSDLVEVRSIKHAEIPNYLWQGWQIQHEVGPHSDHCALAYRRMPWWRRVLCRLRPRSK